MGRKTGMWWGGGGRRPPRPAGMTFDSGRDLLLSYSDERLCLPSDNCSLRGRERSINQNEPRYCRTPPPMADSRMPQQPQGGPGGISFKGTWLVRTLSLLPPPDALQSHLQRGADVGGREGGVSIRRLPNRTASQPKLRASCSVHLWDCHTDFADVSESEGGFGGGLRRMNVRIIQTGRRRRGEGVSFLHRQIEEIQWE